MENISHMIDVLPWCFTFVMCFLNAELIKNSDSSPTNWMKWKIGKCKSYFRETMRQTHFYMECYNLIHATSPWLFRSPITHRIKYKSYLEVWIEPMTASEPNQKAKLSFLIDYLDYTCIRNNNILCISAYLLLKLLHTII